MSVQTAPHRPSNAEIDAATKLGLPDDDAYAESILTLVSLAFDQRNYDEAEAMLTSLIMSRPEDGRLYECFAILHQVRGRPEEARLCFEEALALQPGSPLILCNLGEIYWRFKRDADAARNYLSQVMLSDADESIRVRAQRGLDEIDAAFQ